MFSTETTLVLALEHPLSFIGHFLGRFIIDIPPFSSGQRQSCLSYMDYSTSSSISLKVQELKNTDGWDMSGVTVGFHRREVLRCYTKYLDQGSERGVEDACFGEIYS